MRHHLHTLALPLLLLTATTTHGSTLSGTCGDHAVWDLDNGTLRISGTGPTASFGNPNSIYESYPEWYDHHEEIRHVVVEEGITEIGDFTFYNYTGLESVTLPEGLVKLGSYSFAGCSGLEEIIFPSTIESIGTPLLAYNSNGYTFYGCISLRRIVLPEGLRMISGGSFNDCKMLTEVTWNAIDCAADVLDPVLRYTGIFAGSPVATVTFGPKTASIPAQAFYNVGSLSDVRTSGSIRHVGYQAFHNTYWQQQLPLETVIYIDKAAYLYKSDSSLDGIDETTGLPFHPLHIVLRADITGITDHLFSDNTRLSSIEIPAGTDRIGNNTFSGCTHLTDVVWHPEAILDTEGYDAYKLFDASIRKTPLTRITISEGVRMLPDAFLYGCTNLTEINLPSTLKAIGENAIYGCTGITSLSIPNGVETLAKTAIENCSALRELTIGEGLQTFDYNYFLSGCPNLTTLYWNAIRPETKTLDLYHLSDRCHAPVEHLVIGDRVEYIPGQLFLMSETLREVTFGNSVVEIGEGAFRQCTALSSAALPSSLRTIDSNAFYRSGLEEIIIPAQVERMETWAFGGSALQRVIMLPMESPSASGCFTDLPDDFRCYVPDMDEYKEHDFKSLTPDLEPIAVAGSTTPDFGANPAVTFTCNIPGYTMSVTNMPELDTTPGEHTAVIEADFYGSQEFKGAFRYNYTVSNGAGIHDALIDGDVIELFTIDGRRLSGITGTPAPGHLPSGIYIVRKGATTEKRVVR